MFDIQYLHLYTKKKVIKVQILVFSLMKEELPHRQKCLESTKSYCDHTSSIKRVIFTHLTLWAAV